MSSESRRDFLGGILSGAGKIVSKRLDAAQKIAGLQESPEPTPSSFLKIIRNPDSVRLWTEEGFESLESLRGGLWAGTGATVHADIESDAVRLALDAEGSRPTRLAIRWQGDIQGVRRVLGDAWEQTYGDQEWRAENPARPMPWYFLAYDGKRTHGYGVQTRPGAFCFWTADSGGITLWIDVRSGGVGLNLGNRTLNLCTVVQRAGIEVENPFQAHQAFCLQMCPTPRLTTEPIYGVSDECWLYSDSSAAKILESSRIVSDLSENPDNRPFSVIDAGWSPGGKEAGPFDRGNDRFGDMADLARQLREVGVRPGIWIRPLTAAPDDPAAWRLERDSNRLDPCHPEVLDHVRSMAARVVDWGYELIKLDFTSFDAFGRFGSDMGASVTDDGWSFQDRSKTSAEIVCNLYQAIREGAGYALVMGCNTFSHLAAGFFEINRIGDETSGKDWERTRRMGINALAFRGAHQGALYSADAGICALTQDHLGNLPLQWLRLISQSGTPLFVSIDPACLGPEEWGGLREAFLAASYPKEVAEPVDWLNSTCPSKWKLGAGRKVEYPWMLPQGGDPFSL